MTKSLEPAGNGNQSWSLSEAKDRLEEIVRAAANGEAQHIDIDGRKVVLVAADNVRRLADNRTGQALVDAMQACPYPDFEF